MSIWKTFFFSFVIFFQTQFVFEIIFALPFFNLAFCQSLFFRFLVFFQKKIQFFSLSYLQKFHLFLLIFLVHFLLYVYLFPLLLIILFPFISQYYKNLIYQKSTPFFHCWFCFFRKANFCSARDFFNKQIFVNYFFTNFKINCNNNFLIYLLSKNRLLTNFDLYK